jgi:hypothetical protein
MEEEMISLPLDQAQRAQLFAHLLTYLLCLAMPSARHRASKDLAILQEVAYRLHQFCLRPEERLFGLSMKELATVRRTLLLLQPLYEQEPNGEPYAFVREHLSSCLSLVQQAEQHAKPNAESRDRP